jgi:hypothetical protein
LITHFLGAEEVTAYSRDFAKRLDQLDQNFPTHWFALGLSGRKVVDAIMDLLPHRRDQITLGIAHYDRQSDEIKFSKETPFDDGRLDGQRVLVMDAAVHSGRSMLKMAQFVQRAGAQEITSYTLVLKRGAKLVPTYFGVVIDDKDRIYFDLDVLPNNRLSKPAPTGILRAITQQDLDRPIVETPAPFVGLTVGDLVYERECLGAHVYVFEYADEIVGFVSFRKLGTTLFIDGWYGAKRLRNGEKMKIGGALFRWTETWGRSAQCERIKLWAYEGAVEVYNYLGFTPTEADWRSLGSGQRYRVMEKELLYNIKVTSEPDVEYR